MALLPLLVLTLASSRASASSVTFNKPTIERDGRSLRLDWCYFWEDQCGCRAALAYCRLKGHKFLESFEIDPAVGSERDPTAILSQPGVFCPGHSPGHVCDSFKFITCSDTAPARGRHANDCEPVEDEPAPREAPALAPLLLPPPDTRDGGPPSEAKTRR